MSERAELPRLPEGRLLPCPSSPNCVSSQAQDSSQRVDPLRPPGDPGDAMSILRRVVEALPRTRIVTATDTYLHAECRSRIFRFVDDLDFLLDPEEGVVQVRSASRLGHSDLGVNRRRVEAIREALARH
jgi:uncharacterized protein (DUF1499 family)